MSIVKDIMRRLSRRVPLSAHPEFVENVETIDPQEVLKKLAEIPIQTWNYKSEDSAIRHMGPMAQDFYGSFGLGNTDKAIFHIDAIGVCLASIKGLNQLIEEQNHRIAQNSEKLEKNARLLAQLADLARSQSEEID